MSMVSGVIGGVDTHADVHVAAALDENGRWLGIESFRVNGAGYRRLVEWLTSFGPVIRVGVEGTGSYGVGLARHLHDAGVEVVEVDRPNRQKRRRLGKSDPIDAEAAARAALSGEASVTPKWRDGTVEQMRVLMIARRSARMQRNQALNQLRQIVFCSPDEVRARFKDRYKTGLITEAAAMRPRKGSDPVTYTTHVVMRGLARRIRDLDDEMRTIDDALTELIAETAPSLLACHGVGVVTAATLLVTAGDNPDRLHTERSWAHLCGVSPVPAGSGKTSGRVRLNHGGNRHANAALYQIVLTRMSSDAETRNYVRRRRAEGLSTREIMRCLKRYVARQTFKHLPRAA
ncbi:MAG: IS110 family transposase [Acidimicrobiia bacterium]